MVVVRGGLRLLAGKAHQNGKKNWNQDDGAGSDRGRSRCSATLRAVLPPLLVQGLQPALVFHLLQRFLQHTHTHTRLTALCPGLPG